jgi:hypothetical protein
MEHHKGLTLEKWSRLSCQSQIMNIGAELSRAQNWQNLNKRDRTTECIARAIKLLDLTVQDKRWEDKLKELLRIREALGYFYISDCAPIIYQTYLDWLTQFAQNN